MRHYRYTLDTLIHVIGDQYIEDLTYLELERYFAYVRRDHVDSTGRQQPPVSASGHNNYLGRIKPFCRWLQSRGYTQVDLTLGVPRMREPRVIRLRLSAEQVRQLLDRAACPRDRALIAVGYFTMLRASEIRTLRIQDVNLDTDTLFVHITKTKTEDKFPISPEFHTELERWLNHYRRDLLSSYGRMLAPSDFLIPSYNHHQFDVGFRTLNGRPVPRSKPPSLNPSRSVRHPHLIVKAGLRSIGVPDHREGIHTLRRTAARHLFDALLETTGKYDGALRIVQATLHHASSQQTEIYLGLSSELKARDEFLRSARLLGSDAEQPSADLVSIHDGAERLSGPQAQ